MSFSEALLTFFIKPLEMLLEFVFVIAFKLTDNPGISIVGMSLIMNLLLLPLYNRTDAIQAEAIETEKRLKPYVKHIKKTFRGNEQFMMLQTCYRQNNYKPTDALKGLSPLLLEIPFFTAAYRYLSGLSLLNDASFGPISNLAVPDGLIGVGGLSVNLLPILMTLINVISGIIYTKGAPAKTKIQLYGMAALFLVLLYNAPAGLAFYWTLNNLFSLVKNIFIKLKNPKLVLGISSSVLGLAGLIFLLSVHPYENPVKQLFLILLFVLMQLPLILYFIRKNRRAAKAVEISKKEKRGFLFGCTFLTLLLGVLIPSAVIKSSPMEFVDFTLMNPLVYVLHNFLLCAGLFMLWLNVFYALANPAGKKVMGLAVWLVSGTALVNYMFFGADYGILSSKLVYNVAPAFDKMLPNLVLIAVLAVLLYLIWRKRTKLTRFIYGVLCLAALAMSVINMAGIQKGYREAAAVMEDSDEESKYGILPLSKNGKNVIVIMMDMAVNSYVPYILDEKPQLKEQFAGFTYYPNTITYGCITNAGVPALFGGYDYRPEKINARKNENLIDKHNEALKVMPVLFDRNGFNVTVCDPSYAGYQWVPDLSIYDDYPDINKYHLMGNYNDRPSEEALEKIRDSEYRHFFYYSIFRSSPVILQPTIYNKGAYVAVNPVYDVGYENLDFQFYENNVKAAGMDADFTKACSVLDKMPEISKVQESDENTFLMMSNDTAHEPVMLKLPEYTPVSRVDNEAYVREHGYSHVLNGRELKMETLNHVITYHSNVAAMLKLGEWMDFLRENDVYDNSRIIIVSDHGAYLKQLEDMSWGDEKYEDVMIYNPILLVKDFDSSEFTTDYTFMTNADVPTIATKDLIENPVNPFTGNPIDSEAKKGEQHVLHTEQSVTDSEKYVIKGFHWLSVHDNIFDLNNWKEVTGEMAS
ncbi:MAG: YidC/Oxa1 family membrane protein insertase [Candidatus Limivicinus sp.]|jgi:YidC/Oxa1 family membrane protein insertase